MTAETDANNPIPKITRDGEAAGSGDLVRENVERLKALFPQIVTDGKVDFEVLRQLLGDEVEEGEERYGLNWKGKRRARAFAMTPSLGTLRPAPEDSVDWDTTQNLMIEGDNLEVLKLLRRSYAGRVKAIYIDPPYNTGTNIIYPNAFEDSLSTYFELTGQTEGGASLTTNTDRDGRFHSNWLGMIYPRLLLAKELLKSDGILFVTIDENEVYSLTTVVKEVFGEGGYEFGLVSIVHNPRGQQGKNISYVHENAIVVFPKDGRKYLADVAKDEVDSRNLRDSGTESDRTDARNCFYPFIVRDGKIVEIGDVPPDDFHPSDANVQREDGSIEIWPISETGDEKKWRYAKDSVPRIFEKLEPKMGRSSLQIIFHKDSGTMRSVWQNARYDSSEYGTKLLDDLIPGIGFTYPKSLWAVHDAIRIMTEEDEDAIILDFFAGSGTTGHATMKLNATTGGSRRYIMVQLPEPLDPSDKEQAKGAKFLKDNGKPLNIAELTKERLRRAGQKIRAEHPGAKVDTGFRVYKLATSNLKPWQPDPDNLEASILDAVDNVLPGRTEHDLLVELLLKTGIDLTMPEERRTITGQTVHALGGGALMVCLGNIGPDDAEALGQGMADWLDELDPTQTTIYFKDVGLGTDNNRSATKANLAAILRQRHGDRIAKIASI
jgi:adenine-specific DNA-methyltransferase